MALILIISFVSCFMRLYQLLRLTDSATGLVVSNTSFSYYIYLLLAVAMIVSILYSASLSKSERQISLRGNKVGNAVLIFLCLSFFLDFLHQCSLFYENYTSSEYSNYGYAIFSAVSALLTLLSCLYCIMSLIYFKGTNYKFSSLGFLHFVLIIWALCRMIMILTQIMNIDESAESFCEFIFLTVFVCFLLSLILYHDSKSGGAMKAITVFGSMLFCTSALIAWSRIIAVVSGQSYLLYDVSFTSLTYAIIGVYALVIVLTSVKKDFVNGSET
ncbi:MAG: hypothetical protein LUG95_07270 [Clostridiales bacterium]|nr:hypothetical protein [Clostridiales bacterium]